MTKLTEFLGIDAPIICAPMGGFTNPDLVAALRSGGGFGWLHMLFGQFDALQSDIEKTRKLFNQPKGRLPTGVAFLCWILDKLSKEEAIKLIHYSIDSTQNVWFSFGEKLDRWVTIAREYGGPGFTIFVLVNSEEEALAAYRFGADIIVVQGVEAGGHGLSTAQPLLTLLPSVVKLLATQAPRPSNIASKTPKPFIVAAGGICTGSQVAAALSLGADGVVLGTRFLLTHEVGCSDAQKQLLTTAKETIRTTIFDECAGTIDWPKGVDGRALVNKTSKEDEQGVTIEELKVKYQDAKKKGDLERVVTWAGTSVGLCTKIQPAAEVVRELVQEARLALIGTREALSD